MQFSIKQLLGWTAAVCVFCGVLFGFPEPVGIIILALSLCAAPIFLVVGTIYAPGWTRTFFIGAVMGATPLLLPVGLYFWMMAASVLAAGFDVGESVGQELSSMEWSILLTIKLGLLSPWMLAGCGGLTAIATRWLVEPRAEKTPPAVAEPIASAEPNVSPYAVIEGRMKSTVAP